MYSENFLGLLYILLLIFRIMANESQPIHRSMHICLCFRREGVQEKPLPTVCSHLPLFSKKILGKGVQGKPLPEREVLSPRDWSLPGGRSSSHLPLFS
jgi:hypothetical protein